jgi:hypothetical protein
MTAWGVRFVKDGDENETLFLDGWNRAGFVGAVTLCGPLG